MPVITNQASRFTRRAKSVSWWLAAGVTPVAAYAPKGAASLAASYTNLANPGTYNAAPGTAPTFDTAAGWTFDGATRYLKTAIIASTAWTIIGRFSNWDTTSYNNRYILGAYNASGAVIFGVSPYHTSNNCLYWYGTTPVQGSAKIASGILALSGTKGYKNGAPDATLTNDSAPNVEIYIGALNQDGTASNFAPLNAIISSIWIFDTTLNAAQMAAQSAAMP